MKMTKIIFFGIALFATYSISAQIPTNGLIAEYLFENNLNDTKSTGTPYNLNIIQGTASYFSGTGATGQALYLDGTTKINNTDQSFVTFINSKNPWTINFWFKYKSGLKPGIMGADALISIDQSPQASPYKRVWIQTSDILNCEIANLNYGGNISLHSTNNINDDKWYFASISQDGDSTRMYIDNVLEMVKASMNMGTEPIAAFVIGSVSQSDWASRDFYIGYLDQVRVYNRALSNVEMNSLYYENKCVETVYDTTHITIFDTIPVNPNIPSNGLVAYYPFNGNSNDLSGNNLNGTSTGATLTNDRFGSPEGAYSFNKTNIKVSDNNLLDFTNSFSICAWFNNNNISYLVQGIVGKPRYDGGSGYAINLSNPGNLYGEQPNFPMIGFGINNGSTGANASFHSDSITIGWHFAVGTYDGNQLKLYIDGKLKDTQSISISLPNSGYPLYIGRECGSVDGPIPPERAADTVRYFYGSIDDIRLYNRPLSQNEISSLFLEGQPYEIFIDTVHVQVFDTVTVYKEISVTDTLIIDVLLTGVQPPDDINTLKVYPNPAKDILTINTGNYSEMTEYSIKIVNQLGETVFETTISQPIYEINLSTWTGKGVYVLQIYDGNNEIKAVKKIILQ